MASAPDVPPAAGPRPSRPRHQARVVRTERPSPSFLRLTLGGPGLAAFTPSPFADSYVKLEWPVPDGSAARRAYTVRAAGTGDDEHPELTLDVVLHGGSSGGLTGMGAPWAATAQPGDEITLLGPGGAWSPDPKAAWHLFAGDASAAPAIAAGVARLPAGAKAVVVVEAPTGDDVAHLTRDLAPADGREVTLVLPVADHGAPGAGLVAAVRAVPWRAERIDAFVHGEAGAVRLLRAYLRTERAVPREELSISGYWRLGAVDEVWRATKRAWLAEIEAAEAAAGVA